MHFRRRFIEKRKNPFFDRILHFVIASLPLKTGLSPCKGRDQSNTGGDQKLKDQTPAQTVPIQVSVFVACVLSPHEV